MLACRSFLRTLDLRNISNGAAEMLKMACIKDATLFSLLEQHAEQLRMSRFQVRAWQCATTTAESCAAAIAATNAHACSAINPCGCTGPRSRPSFHSPCSWLDRGRVLGVRLHPVFATVHQASLLFSNDCAPKPGRAQDAAASAAMRRSIQGMLEELEPNLWEHVLCRLVDYGHTFSPELEMAALTHGDELLHGEAVNIDMALTTQVLPFGLRAEAVAFYSPIQACVPSWVLQPPFADCYGCAVWEMCRDVSCFFVGC